MCMYIFDSPTFRKLFPEYVEKYEQQWASEHPVVEEVPRQEEKSEALAVDKKEEEEKRVELAKAEEGRNRNRKQSFPTWMVLLLLSFVGLVMALPLLQL